MKPTRSSVVLFLLSCLPLTAAVDTGRPTSSTVYDAYMGPMRQTYARFTGRTPTLDEVRSQLRTAKRFRYYFDSSNPYVPQLPEVTEAKREGDCKAKSLWLAYKMSDRKTRYVVGKISTSSRMAHAWLLWPNGGQWLILDPTWNSEVVDAERVAGKKWLARYSYVGSTAYLHSSYPQ